MIGMEIDTRAERRFMEARGTAMEGPQRTGVTAATTAVQTWVHSRHLLFQHAHLRLPIGASHPGPRHSFWRLAPPLPTPLTLLLSLAHIELPSMAGALPVELAENLLPRRYQEEIFMRAQEGNIIAALDTGSGKTFISILLMKWIAARYTGDKKVVVFLVPKVALVEQQADFIVKQTPLRVSRYYGAMAIDMSDRSKWKLEFENSDVLVMTGASPIDMAVTTSLKDAYSPNIP